MFSPHGRPRWAALVERQKAAEALEQHPGLLRLAELEALRELARNANRKDVNMLKLNVGLSRKIGEASFSSRGASVNLEVETTSGLDNQPDRLLERLRRLFQLARAAVVEELTRPQPPLDGQAQRETEPDSTTCSIGCLFCRLWCRAHRKRGHGTQPLNWPRRPASNGRTASLQ